jgi:hypothetical protein
MYICKYIYIYSAQRDLFVYRLFVSKTVVFVSEMEVGLGQTCGKEVVWSSVGSSVLACSGDKRGRPGVGILT